MTQKGIHMNTATIILIIIASLVVITGIILLIAAIIEPHKLNVTNEALSDEARSGKPDVRLLFFSDLHAEFCFIPKEKVADLIRREASDKGLDAVIFGGDIINNPDKYELGVSYLSYIGDICRELNIPFAGVNGNHDVKIPQKGIDACSFYNLGGKYIVLKSRNDGSDIAISGVGDSGRKNRVWYDIPSVPDSCKKNILVAHNPDQILNIEDCSKVDFMLSGHIHGGQIRTPFRIEFTILRKDILPKHDIIAGSYRLNGIALFISRGIGCIRLPLRLKALPEVNIIEI